MLVPEKTDQEKSIIPEEEEADGDDIDIEMEDNEELLLQKLDEIGDSGRNKHKTFEGIPKQWH